MNKTRLGISTNMLAFAAILLIMFGCGGFNVYGGFGSFLAPLLVVGYVLIREDDMWLKKVVVKAFAVAMAFSLLIYFIEFLPELMTFINNIFDLWGGNFHVSIISAIIMLIYTIISILQKVVLLILAFMSLGGKWFRIGFIDKFVEKHFA